MHPSVDAHIDDFITRSREREEALWSRRLAVLRVLQTTDIDEPVENMIAALSPPITLREVLEIPGLVERMRRS